MNGGVSPEMAARFEMAEGEKAEKAGNHAKAVEHFEKALKLRNAWSSSELRMAYARSLSRVGRKEDAAKEARAYKAGQGRTAALDAEADIYIKAVEGPGVLAPGQSVTLDLGDGVTMTLNRIPAGQFMMGSPPDERGELGGNEGQPHLVTISKPFHMGIYPVTQIQYLAVMGTNPSQFADVDHPVEWLSWNDAVEFCKKLSEKTGRKVRLPTEAEWEYACRAGTTTTFNTGDTLTSEQANFSVTNGIHRMTSVGSYPANALGLFDMHGNVLEWC